MKRHRFAAALLVSLANPAAADTQMEVGDGRIDGTRIAPFSLTWQQCSVADGEWQDGGSLTEEIAIIGPSILRHRRTTLQAGDIAVEVTTYFDRASFAPLRMETRATGPDGSALLRSERELTTDGYRGAEARGGETKQMQGAISSMMLDGGLLGLPLSTMTFQEEPVEFLASMIKFDASYRVIAEWVGRDTLEFGGREIEAWLIDVEWHHREQGDVYPPGPNAGGGRYWVVPDPPDGFPYVPRYKTDTYAVEFTAGVCASSRAD